MSVSIEQFVQHLAASGLLTAAEVASFQESLAPSRRPKDAEGLARELVRANKLTKYQAQVVYQGKTKGLVFGEYRVLDKLGQGGMGVVVKAEHRRMERIVAVKMISAAQMKSPDAVKRFYREVKAAARLEHSNIVTAYDAGEHEAGHYLVMQYVDGKDLAAVVKERGPLPIRQAVDYVLQAARGLEYAHKQGVVHRDIKPSNLLLDREGTVKILDMGLALIGGPAGQDDKDRLTASGEVMGTCDYMAPEQAFDTHTADARSDIYSLGCTLYRLLTGKAPYHGDSLVQVLMAHREAPIPSLGKARTDVPAELEAIFQKLLAKRPEDRYPSMTEVVTALEAFNFWARDELPLPASDVPPSAPSVFSLRRPSQGGTAAAVKQRAADKREETLRRQAEETGRSLGLAQKLLAVPRQNKPLAAAIGLATLAVVGVLFWAVTVRVRHPDGKETSVTVPDGSTVTVDPKGEVAVTLQGEGGQRSTSPIPPSQSPIPNPQSLPPPPAVAPFDAKKAKVYQESWAKHLGVSVEETNSIGMKLVLIPPGEFDMGSTPGEIAAEIERAKKDLKETEWEDSLEGYWLNLRTEGPRRRVKIAKPFCLGVYPVPQGDYEKVMGTNPSVFTEKPVDLSTFKPPLSEKERKAREVEVKKSKKFAGKDTSRFPVETVSWEDALEFCRRLSALPGERAAVRTYRLPTQAEWEYACRAGTTTRWYCGDDEASLEECAWYGKNSGWTTHPVGTKRANAWRLCDMAGQVAQWCADSGKRYTHHRVTRGSGYASSSLLCRSAHGSEGLPAYRVPNTGFRVVADMARP